MDTEIKNEFQQTSNELINMLSALQQEEINKIPFEDSWTPGQLADHLLKSYSVSETLNGHTKKTERDPLEKVETFKSIFQNFTNTMKSPDFIVPTNDEINKSTLIAALQIKIKEINAVINEKDLSETCTDFKLPNMGELTRIEWLYFMLYHTQRHNHQLKNIISKL